jgi:hypothetical protein
LAAFEWSAPGPRTRSGTGFAAATERASNWARSAAAAAYSAAGRHVAVSAERMTATVGQKTRHLHKKGRQYDLKILQRKMSFNSNNYQVEVALPT